MNKNLWITNHFKKIRRIQRYDSLLKLKGILLNITNKEKLRLLYINRKGR